jgi:prophage regulatory protein
MARIIRLPEVAEKTGLGKSTVWLFVSRGEFPAPVELGVRARGWREEQVDAWIAERPARSTRSEPIAATA